MLTSLDIGKKLKELRTKNNLSQTDLAKKLNVGQDKISRLEQGKTDFDCSLLFDIATLFNVSADYLLGLTNAETELKTDKDKALRISCDYTGLEEQAINKLHKLVDPELAEPYINIVDNDFYFHFSDKNNKKIINDFIASDTFENIIYCASKLLLLNTDALHFLSLFFQDHDYLKAYYKTDSPEKGIEFANLFINEYKHSSFNNLFKDKQDLILFKIQKDIVSFFEHIANTLFEIDTNNLTNSFDLLCFSVFDAIIATDRNDIEKYKSKLSEQHYSSSDKLKISKLKEIYEKAKNNEQ